MLKRLVFCLIALYIGVMVVALFPQMSNQLPVDLVAQTNRLSKDQKSSPVELSPEAEIINQVPLAKLPTATQIIVEKSERRLDVLSGDKIIRTYPMRLGFSPKGTKEKEGDGKTPEGDYVIDWRNPKSMYYKSLHVSYPNAEDKHKAKMLGVNPGGDIMIHALPNSMNTAGQPLHNYIPDLDWTAGCIAVSNTAMDELWVLIKDGTPVKINP